MFIVLYSSFLVKRVKLFKISGVIKYNFHYKLWSVKIKIRSDSILYRLGPTPKPHLSLPLVKINTWKKFPQKLGGTLTPSSSLNFINLDLA